jgi:hypothetical protein
MACAPRSSIIPLFGMAKLQGITQSHPYVGCPRRKALAIGIKADKELEVESEISTEYALVNCSFGTGDPYNAEGPNRATAR